MRNVLKRLAVRKKGMEALQAVLIAVVGFFIVTALKDLGGKSAQGCANQSKGIFDSIGGAIGDVAGGVLGKILPF